MLPAQPRHCCCCCCCSFSCFFLPRLLLANCQPQDTDTQHSWWDSQYSLFWILLGVLGTHNTRCTNTLSSALSLPLSFSLVGSLSLSCRIHISRGFARSSPNSCGSVCISLWVVSRLVRFWVRPDLKKYYKKKHNIENNLTTKIRIQFVLKIPFWPPVPTAAPTTKSSKFAIDE